MLCQDKPFSYTSKNYITKYQPTTLSGKFSLVNVSIFLKGPMFQNQVIFYAIFIHDYPKLSEAHQSFYELYII